MCFGSASAFDSREPGFSVGAFLGELFLFCNRLLDLVSQTSLVCGSIVRSVRLG